MVVVIVGIGLVVVGDDEGEAYPGRASKKKIVVQVEAGPPRGPWEHIPKSHRDTSGDRAQLIRPSAARAVPRRSASRQKLLLELPLEIDIIEIKQQ